MELLGLSEVLPVANRHFFGAWSIRIGKTSFQGVEVLEDWHFDLSCDSSSVILAELGSVPNTETIRGEHFDLESHAIQLCHALDFLEHHGVSITEPMLLALVQEHDTFRLICDQGNENGFLLLSSCINDLMLVSEVDESEPIESQVAPVDEPDSFFPAGFVQLDQVISVVGIEHDNTVVVGNSG